MPDNNANWIPSLAGKIDPQAEQAIRHLYTAVYKLRDHVGKAINPDGSVKGMDQIPKASIANPQPVAPPPNLDGHPGLLSQPQKGMATAVTTPPSQSDILSRPGAMITYKGSIYVYDGSTTPGVFRLLGALSTPI